MENDQFQWENSLYIVIFHSYVNLPERPYEDTDDVYVCRTIVWHDITYSLNLMHLVYCGLVCVGQVLKIHEITIPEDIQFFNVDVSVTSCVFGAMFYARTNPRRHSLKVLGLIWSMISS